MKKNCTKPHIINKQDHSIAHTVKKTIGSQFPDVNNF